MTGRGLHHTPATGIYADVWQWKATGVFMCVAAFDHSQIGHMRGCPAYSH
jgi:hypothetical protein